MLNLDGKRIGQIYHARLKMPGLQLYQSPHFFKTTSLTVRNAFMVDQKLPNATCLIVIDSTTYARK